MNTGVHKENHLGLFVCSFFLFGTGHECSASLFSPDEHGHLKIYLPKKLLECLPKCSSLPKERHRWNTNEV